jgi:hypothetical protein
MNQDIKQFTGILVARPSGMNVDDDTTSTGKEIKRVTMQGANGLQMEFSVWPNKIDPLLANPQAPKTVDYTTYKFSSGQEAYTITQIRSGGGTNMPQQVAVSPPPQAQPAGSPPPKVPTIPMHHMTAANCATEIVSAIISKGISDNATVATIAFETAAIIDLFDDFRTGILACIEGTRDVTPDDEDDIDLEVTV